MKTAFRWILVLPVALAAYFLSQFLIGFVNDDVPVFVGQLYNSAVGPLLFVMAGVWVAPDHKFATALTLTVVHSMFVAALLALVLYGAPVADPVWWLIVCGVVGVAVPVAYCVQCHKSGMESTQSTDLPLS